MNEIQELMNFYYVKPKIYGFYEQDKHNIYQYMQYPIEKEEIATKYRDKNIAYALWFYTNEFVQEILEKRLYKYIESEELTDEDYEIISTSSHNGKFMVRYVILLFHSKTKMYERFVHIPSPKQMKKNIDVEDS